ncbi:MAG: glycosyltransferase family 4 protein [Sphingomonadaceae bacterium]|nr:glycosyltransferase family 4 protein [Sphingomonadaceae bacterium]
MNNPPAALRAAIVASGDPRDISLWSGIPFHMVKALERQFDVVLVVERPWPAWFRPLGGIMKRLSGGRFRYLASQTLTRVAAATTIRRLRRARPDVVLAISASPLAHALTAEFRVVNIADATVRAMRGYYDAPAWNERTAAADAIEAKLIRGALLSLYPSRWASDSALIDYGAAPERVRDIAWGSNIVVAAAVARTLPAGPLRLLFVGVEWDRKGGPLALDVMTALTAAGIACRLDIVGVSADVLGDRPIPPGIVFHGFLSKADATQAATLADLYRDATFFLLPTRAECFGIVFAEAASRGLPSISVATGGVPSAVRDGMTGILLPPAASGSDFAAAIVALVAEPARYAAMSQAALDDARERLNWDVWAAAAEAAIRAILPRGPHGAN